MAVTDASRLSLLRDYAAWVLRVGRDHYGPQPTPLLVDGVRVSDGAPAQWRCDGQDWVISNLASQQNLFRFLAGLTALTGEAQFRDAALAATRHHLDHLRRSCGLLQWGGHRLVDLRTHRVVGEQDVHEYKCHYPYYELLHELDPGATTRLLRALWQAHVLDWQTLDMNRHGKYDQPNGPDFSREFTPGEPFFQGKGLTFINCGSDLIYAGGWLHQYTGDADAWRWTMTLARQYVRARDPRTGLGAYQYSQTRADRPPRDDRDTASQCGDRCARQFGPEFGARALEGRMLDPGRANLIYGRAALAQLRLCQGLGARAGELLESQRAGLVALARHAYDGERHRLIPQFTDGTRLTPANVVRPGYYRPEVFEPAPPSEEVFLAAILAACLTGDDDCWQLARRLARHAGLGELGATLGAPPAPAKTVAKAHPVTLLAVLELQRYHPHPGLLDLARQLGDRLLAQHWHHGAFLPSARHVHACFDTLEPLALLTLEAHLRGQPAAVAPYPGGRGYIHGPHDGVGRTYDFKVIWSVVAE